MLYINKFFYNLKCLLIDPFGIRKEVRSMNTKTAMFQGDLLHSIKRLEELIKAYHTFEHNLEEYKFFSQVNKALHYSVPDMFWVKDLEGKYVIANQAIRDGLLFDENPIGKNDRELALSRKAVVGDENHTFGAICGNSDLEVLKQEKPMKFLENGLVSGRNLELQVHKNVVRNSKGEVIATCGVGRDVTTQVEKLEAILKATDCDVAKEGIKEILNHYRFKDRA